MLALSACGDDEDAGAATTAAAGGTISVAEAWSPQPAEAQPVSAVYGVVSNPTDEAVTIVSASSPVSGDVQLHETVEDDNGAMTMQEREGGFEVPAGGEFVFESGGPHIMLLDIDPATYPDTVEVTLTLDQGGPVTFTAEVREFDETMDMSGEMSS